MALYTVVFNIYLHSGVVFLPVLLAKGISVIYSKCVLSLFLFLFFLQKFASELVVGAVSGTGD